MRAALLFPLLLCLGACSGEPIGQSFLASAGAPLVAPVTGAAVGPSSGAGAVLALPGAAGTIAQVRERAYPNGARQVAVLRDESGRPSANDIELSVARSAGGRAGWLAIGKPSANGVRSEILSRFPRLRMEIVTRPMYNALGRFGLAIGRDPSGMRCVFAWQWLDDLRDSDPDRPTLSKTMDSFDGRGLPASIRVRLCRTDMTLDQLASQIEGMTLTDPQNLRALAALIGSGDGGGGGGLVEATAPGGLSPVSESLESALGPAAPPRPLRTPWVRKQGHAASASPYKAARRSRRRPSPAVAARPRPTSRPQGADQGSDAGDGVRYLAPVESGQGGAAGQAPAQVPHAGRSVAVGPKLPPQAFTGPVSGASAPRTPADPYGAPTAIGAAP